MKLLYLAANSIEAHLILNLLEQEGLSGSIEGEMLQGGFGDLPAINIRVMVEEKDYVAAKNIVDDWDKKQQPIESTSVPTKRFSFGSVAVGFFIGVIATAIYFHVPVYYDGVDYNGDGKLDETWITYNYKISEVKVDRNFDGKIDYIVNYNRKGFVETSSSDEDFNGTFETSVDYKNGNPYQSKSDTQDIGVIDYIIRYKDGVMETETFFDLVTTKPVKINYYKNFRIHKSETDTDRDGILDKEYRYDKFNEIIESKTIPKL